MHVTDEPPRQSGDTMSAAATIYNPGRVLVADGIVYVRELEEHDPEVVRIISESDDPLAAIRQCLRIGARALRAAHVTVDVDVIERSFHELETRFESRVTDAVDEIARTTSGLLDEDTGALVGALTAFRTEFDQLLGDTFDAKSKVSVITKIEELVLSTMKGLITPEIDDSPIGRLKKELVDTVQREVGDVADEVRRVTEHLGMVDATEPTRTSTPPRRASTTKTSSTSVSASLPPATATSPRAPPTSRDRARRRWATRWSRSTATTRTASRLASRSR